jgi:hypothetical protein
MAGIIVALIFVAVILIAVILAAYLFHVYTPCKYAEKITVKKTDKTAPKDPEDALLDPQQFAGLWKGMTDWRRKNQTGLFVRIVGREPTEEEVLTGDINNEL